MVNRRKWARGSNQYVKRPGVLPPRHPEAVSVTLKDPTLDLVEDRRLQLEATGVSWSDLDVERVERSTPDRSRYRFRAHLPDLIWNAAALEGNNFTLPEVKTLLEGVTVGGRRLEDEEQILALSAAYNRLDEMVAGGTFSLSKQVSDELHGLVAVHEAIEAGHFRGEGRVQGGGTVSLANGGSVPGTEHGEGGALLRQHFEDLVDYLHSVDDPRRRALIYFASATRRQLYFDGNKRTARLMMTGELMSSGYEVLSVPFNRRLEYNNALDVLFERDDATELLRFLITCTL
jgi:Fic family protein